AWAIIAAFAHEAQRIALSRAPRPHPPRSHLGPARRAATLPAARLDGRFRIVPVPGRQLQSRMARDRARLERGWGVALDARGLLVPGLLRRPGDASRHLPAAGPGEPH